MKILGSASLLIESSYKENGEQFHAYVTELIVAIFGRSPEWLKFKEGRRFKRQDIFYREFLCAAGGVDGQIQLHAEKGNMARAIILRGTHLGRPCCSEIRAGIEIEFDCDELAEVI